VEGESEVVRRDPYPDLLQVGIKRLRGHLARFGYGIAETRPRADRYFLRFGTDEASLIVSISVDAAGWQLVVVGRGIKYDTGELVSRVPTLEALGELFAKVNPPPAPHSPPKPKQRVTESSGDRAAYLAGAFEPTSVTVDELLREEGAAWRQPLSPPLLKN